MCLTTKNPTIKVATRDIKVYKIAFDVNEESCMTSMCRTPYIRGKDNPHVALRPRLTGGNRHIVEEGYHGHRAPHSYTNTLFIIPKGTQYIDGYNNDDEDKRDRVASNIVYVGPRKYNSLYRWLLQKFS